MNKIIRLQAFDHIQQAGKERNALITPGSMTGAQAFGKRYAFYKFFTIDNVIVRINRNFSRYQRPKLYYIRAFQVTKGLYFAGDTRRKFGPQIRMIFFVRNPNDL